MGWFPGVGRQPEGLAGKRRGSGRRVGWSRAPVASMKSSPESGILDACRRVFEASPPRIAAPRKSRRSSTLAVERFRLVCFALCCFLLPLLLHRVPVLAAISPRVEAELLGYAFPSRSLGTRCRRSQTVETHQSSGACPDRHPPAIVKCQELTPPAPGSCDASD